MTGCLFMRLVMFGFIGIGGSSGPLFPVRAPYRVSGWRIELVTNRNLTSVNLGKEIYLPLQLMVSGGIGEKKNHRRLRPFVSYEAHTINLSVEPYIEYSLPMNAVARVGVGLNYENHKILNGITSLKGESSLDIEVTFLRHFWNWRPFHFLAGVNGGVRFYSDLQVGYVGFVGQIVLLSSYLSPSLSGVAKTETKKIEGGGKGEPKYRIKTLHNVVIPAYAERIRDRRLFLDEIEVIYSNGNISDTVVIFSNGRTDLPISVNKTGKNSSRLSLESITIHYFTYIDKDKRSDNTLLVPVVGKNIKFKPYRLVKTNLYGLNLRPVSLFSKDTITLIFNKKKVSFVKRTKIIKDIDFMDRELESFKLKGMDIATAIEGK